MRRTRMRAAGVMLLSTLLLSFAEGAWAIACDPDVADRADASMAGMPGHDAVPAGHEHSPGHDSDGSRDADRNCPFAPAGGSGCVASATLPGVTTQIAAPAPVKDVSRLTTAVHLPDLQVHAIFHPPKA